MSDLNGKTLLIVDDEPDLREVLALQFENFGLNITEAGNGAEALDIVARGGVDAILSDVRMPTMDGGTFLNNLRQSHGNDIGLVLLTGYSDMPEHEAYARGASGLVKKPYDRDQLASTVMNLFLTPELRLMRTDYPTPQTAIELDFGDDSDASNSKKISFARGGFFLCLEPNQLPRIDEVVEFSFRFAKGPIENISGVGIVRFNRTNSEKLESVGTGVEILSLHQDQIPKYLAMVQESVSPAYIPNSLF